MSDETAPAESAEPAGTTEPVHEPPADQEPDEFGVTTETPIEREDVNREVGGMVGSRPGTAAGNIANLGQTAVGAGAMAAEAIVYTTVNLGRENKGWGALVPADRITALIGGYASAPSDAELTRCLKERCVVYLSAPPGWGRYAAAQVALAARHAPGRVVMIRIAPGQRIVDAIAEQEYFEDDHGHVVDATKADSIELVDLLSIGRQLRGKNATAVVIGPLAERGHDLGAYLLEHRRPPATEVFRGRLTYLLELQGGCVGSCGARCRRDCVPEHVDGWVARRSLRQHLNDALSLEEAAKIAEVIAAGRTDAGLGDRLADELYRRLLVQARTVLRAEDEEGRVGPRPWSGTAEYRRAFRLAFAALEGSPLSVVHEATDRLLRILCDETPGSPAPERVAFELDGLLSYGMRVPGRDVALPGEPRVARLADSALVAALLDVAWNERGLGSGLLRWLGELAGSPRWLVRRRAALVTGLLCVNDFDAVMDGLVGGWARQSRNVLRQAAGLSLLSCAYHPALRDRLARQLEAWVTTGRATVHTRDSVAWAYAYGLGVLLPDRCLSHLRRAATDARQRRSPLVAKAVDGSYTPERAAAILAELGDWFDEPSLRVHAARAFVELARRRTSGGKARPELVDRCGHGQVEEEHLVRPWSIALSLQPTAAGAFDALTGWLTLGEDVPEAADPFLRLIRALAQDPALRPRLVHQHDHVWREQRAPSPLLDAVAATLGRNNHVR